MPLPSPRRPALSWRLAVAAVALALIAVLWLELRPLAPTPSAASPRPSARAFDATGKKITLLTLTPHVRTAEAQARWFQEETGAVVQVKVVNYENLKAAAQEDHASGAPVVDVFYVFYTDLPALVEAGVAMDVTDYIRDNESVLRTDDFIPGLYDPSSLYKGRRWALPIDGDTHVLFYRKSLLQKHGLAPPETWDDYLHVARTITDRERERGIYGAAIMANPAPVLIISSFMNRLVAYGGELLDREGRPALNTPEAVAALSALIEHAKVALPTPLETDFDAARAAFLSGRVAMVEQWTDIGIMAEDPTQSTIRGDWGVVQLPIGTGPKARRAAPMNASLSLAVAATTREPDVARAFLRFSTRPDILLRLNLLNGGIDPARTSILESKEYRSLSPLVSAAKKASLEHVVPWPARPETPALLAALVERLVEALEGKVTPEAALNAGQAAWLQILPPPAGR